MLRFVPDADWRELTLESGWVRAPGLALLVLSTAFTLWARVSLGVMWSSAVVTRVGHELRTGGPYRIVRHPIYTGVLGMVLGTALLNGFGRWTFAVAAGVVLVAIKMRAEERLLSELFPQEYERYRQRVPRLVPRPAPRRGNRP